MMADNPAPGSDSTPIERIEGLFADDGSISSEQPETEEVEETEEVSAESEETELEPESEEEIEESTLEVEADGEEEQAPEEPEGESDRYTVKVNGVEHEVTLSELTSGYSRESDYRQKTQTLADERRAFEADMVTKHQQADAEARAKIEQLANLYQSLESQGEREPNWDELFNTDLNRYQYEKAAWDRKTEAKKAANDAINVEVQRLQAENQQRLIEHVDGERQALIRVLPDMADDTKATDIKRRVANYLLNEGYTQSELDQLTDHRTFMQAHKAMKYDALVKKKPALAKKIKGAKKMLKPGSSPEKGEMAGEERQRLRKQLRRSGQSGNRAVNTETLTKLLEDYV